VTGCGSENCSCPCPACTLTHVVLLPREALLYKLLALAAVGGRRASVTGLVCEALRITPDAAYVRLRELGADFLLEVLSPLELAGLERQFGEARR